MKTCPYCAEEIQDAAIVCKHCRRDLEPAIAAPTEPSAVAGKPPVSNAAGCLVAAVVSGALFVGWCAAQSPSSGSDSAQKGKSDAQCKVDLSCWAEKSMVNAEVNCRRPVERMAKNNFEWTDSFLDRKFTHYRWKNQAAGEITYLGDKIKFQNGFGAWTFYTYECDLAANGETVLDVRASPGRLR